MPDNKLEHIYPVFSWIRPKIAVIYPLFPVRTHWAKLDRTPHTPYVSNHCPVVLCEQQFNSPWYRPEGNHFRLNSLLVFLWDAVSIKSSPRSTSLVSFLGGLLFQALNNQLMCFSCLCCWGDFVGGTKTSCCQTWPGHALPTRGRFSCHSETRNVILTCVLLLALIDLLQAC